MSQLTSHRGHRHPVQVVICAAVCVALAACSSVPKVVVPDGSGRKPVNTEARIAAYQARSAEEQASALERGALMRQVTALQGEVTNLKSFVVQLSMVAAANADQAGPARATAVARAESGIPSGSVEFRDSAVVFRVNHEFAKTDFRPTPQLEDALLKAARVGSRIEVRGRTDSPVPTSADYAIARQRALRAQRFLVANGVDPKRIHVSFMAAGDFVADNSTAEGRARNRRVEIAAYGVTADTFTSATVGSL